jgi:hypothetical protein
MSEKKPKGYRPTEPTEPPGPARLNMTVDEMHSMLVGGLAGMAGTYYQRKQTRLMQEQIDGLKGRDTSYAEWTAKWEQAADALAKIYPGLVTLNPTLAQMHLDLYSLNPCFNELNIILEKRLGPANFNRRPS